MAKKAKARASKARAAKAESVKPSETLAVPSEKKLKQLMSSIKNAEADKNESVGRIGSLISNAVEKDHLDKAALAVLRKLDRMSNMRGATSWAHIQHYVEVYGLEKRWAQQEQMFKRPELGEDDEKKPRPGSFAEKMQQGAEQLQEHAAKTLESKTPPRGDAFPDGPSSDARH